MHDVLISYSTKDQKWADAACSVLEARGIRCWIAPRDIIPGTEWAAAIIAGIDACKVVVLIFSASANASPQVRREVERAISKGLTVVPCRIENVMPVGAMEYALGNTHWLDVFTPPVERQMKRLAESVQALLPRKDGVSSVAGGPSLASDSTARNKSARENSIPKWNRRGMHRLFAAVGATLFILLAVSMTVAFWPRKNAVSTQENPGLEPATVEPKPTLAATHPRTVGFLPLFNGKDLTGWYARSPGDLVSWGFEDGVLVCRSAKPRWGQLDSVRSDYTDFHLRMQTMLSDGEGGPWVSGSSRP
jgi:TIR domain/Domain of Unknown Function (DUF1080)